MPRGGGPGRPPIAVDPEVSRRVVEAAKAAASAPRRAPTRRGETRGSGDGANNSVTFSPAFDQNECRKERLRLRLQYTTVAPRRPLLRFCSA